MKILTKALSAVLIIATIFAFGACKKEDDTQIKIGVLNGPTGMGIAKLAEDSTATADAPDGYKIEFKATTQVKDLQDGILNGTYDMVALPINACAALFNKSEGKLQVIAVNALGGLSIIGQTQISSITELKGKTVHAAGKGATPEYIIRHILTANGMNMVTDDSTPLGENDVRVKLYTDGGEAKSNMALDATSYAMLPEHATTAALASVQNCKLIFDVTAEWNKICETKVVQGCIVATKQFVETYPNAVKKFLTALNASVEYTVNPDNADEAAAVVAKHVTSIPNANIAKQAIKRAGITFICGDEMKTDVSAMLKILFDINPASIGGKLPEDSFYGDFNID